MRNNFIILIKMLLFSFVCLLGFEKEKERYKEDIFERWFEFFKNEELLSSEDLIEIFSKNVDFVRNGIENKEIVEEESLFLDFIKQKFIEMCFFIKLHPFFCFIFLVVLILGNIIIFKNNKKEKSNKKFLKFSRFYF